MTRAEELRRRAAALVAKAERIETGQSAPRLPKVLLSDVRNALSGPLGMKPETLQVLIRRLKEEGVRESHGSGPSECPRGVAVTILVGALASASIVDCAEPTKALLSAKPKGRSGEYPSWLTSECNLAAALGNILDEFVSRGPIDFVLSIDRTHRTARVEVKTDGATWETYFGLPIEAGEDRIDCCAVSGRTIEVLASLYRRRP